MSTIWQFEEMMPEDPYRRPELYELAFAWREYPRAVDFLIEAAQLAGRSGVSSMVELGCGPAQYAHEFAKRGITAYGVDRAPEMVRYAQRYWNDERLPGGIVEADMCRFRLDQPVDLACCMMATFTLLTTNREVLAHFEAVADNLNADGIYIVEMPHPRDVLEREESTKDVWEMEGAIGKLEIDWASDAVLDPTTEVSRGTVRFKLHTDDGHDEYAAPESSRGYSLGLMRALLELSGRFKIAGLYGDIDTAVPFDNDKKAWRMVMVLRKFG
jgi:SAM-dependent methyltransferase